MRQVLAYLERDYARAIGLRDAAMLIGVHPDYLCRRFKKELGIGFHEYLVWIRVQRASLLLVGTAKSVKEIGYEVGFSAPEIFCKVFKRLIGCSPRVYRDRSLSLSGGANVPVVPLRSSQALLAQGEPGVTPIRSLQTVLEVKR
jgi:AraC-like DNA-binding protein